MKELLLNFNMNDCKSMLMFMHPSIGLSKDESGKLVDQTIYRGMIGSLLHLTTSGSDIIYSVCLCAHF
uniref:Retrovirus-related Pol polyprotein from transposon TNT 1-94 n=1 Tax=Cajanus cajan TaxID=3821 RepID=A0A151SSB6_CAJCA|nr:hypothetical protein KK1_003990 [Cajanus cajan]